MYTVNDVEADPNEIRDESQVTDDLNSEVHAQTATWRSELAQTKPCDNETQHSDDEHNDNVIAAENRSLWSHWLGLRSEYVPSDTARDFCMRERTYMSWVKFFTMLTIISAVMFLDLQLSNPTAEGEELVFRTIPTTKPRSQPASTQDIVLGSIYLITAFVTWVVTTCDYFKRIDELEREHIYLDECEESARPVMKLFSMAICIIILATVILLLVQHKT